MATPPNRNRKGRYPTKQGGRPMGSKAVRNTRRKTQAKRTTKSRIPRSTKRMVKGRRPTPRPMRQMQIGGGASCVNITNSQSCIVNGCSWQSVANTSRGGYCIAGDGDSFIRSQRRMAKGGKPKSQRTSTRRMIRGGKVLKNRMSGRSQSNPKGKPKR
tara:strand:+ start:71 stop:544 length:474 start_codon:yes stop_codon:yes gene_type:complete